MQGSVKVICPVGHPSGAGRHCPLCGRAYVPVTELTQPVWAPVPQPRHALEDEVHVRITMPPLADEDPRFELEALAMLSSLASDADY